MAVTTMTTIRMGNVNVPLAVYQEGSGLTISNLTFYINKTDSHGSNLLLSASKIRQQQQNRNPLQKRLIL